MHDDGVKMIDESVNILNSQIIQPSLIGKNVVIKNAIVGPYASIGEGCVIERSVVENCIIQSNTKIKNAVINNAMLGSYVEYQGEQKDLSIGDYTTVI
jgi:glucose-1-phosphate thymidylyltransferase